MKRSLAQKIRAAILQASESLSDEVAIEVPELFDNWHENTVYTIGERRQYNGILYKCIQAHTSQIDWTPDVAVSLWAHTSIEEWPEWIQPTGAQDAYNAGDKVTYNGIHYTSNVDSNVWAPDVYGWTIAEE